MLQPIKFNDTAIPFLSSWQESYSPVETVNVTEAGTDQVLISRSQKLTVSAGGTLLSTDVATLEAVLSLPSFTLTLSDGSEYTVRMREYSKSRKAHSEEITSVDGIWTVSFSLIEF